MTSYYGEQRQRLGRGTLFKSLFLWLVTLGSSIFVGLFFGLACFLIGLALQSLTDFFVASNEQIFFLLGFYSPIFLSFFGPGIFITFADRIGPWLLDAEEMERDDTRYPKIRDAFAQLSIAAMNNPIIYVADASWHNATAFGKRKGQPVVLLSSACENLSLEHLQVVAATCLADVYEGKGVGRIWLALRVPAISMRMMWKFLRHHQLLFLGLFVAGLAGVAVQKGIGEAIAIAVLFPFLCFFLFGVCLLWLLTISKIGKMIAANTHAVADIGAIGLLKHPEQWQSAMSYFSQTGFNDNLPQMPRSADNMFEWLLPQNQKQLYTRYQALFKAIPATSFSLDKQAMLIKSLGLEETY